MSGDQIAQLTYLVLLAAAIGGSAIVAGRSNWGRMAQQAAIWALIFVGVIGAYGLWGDVASTIAPRQTVTDAGSIRLPRGSDGHYSAVIAVNGIDIRFIVDTGASQVVLSAQDARRIGIDPASLSYTGRANTANGTVQTAPIMLTQMDLGGIRLGPLPAVVNGGAMDQSLLGMRYLSQFSRIEIIDDQMILTP